MMMAAVLSEELGDISIADVSLALKNYLLVPICPPVSPDTMQPEDYLPHMMRDKKFLSGKLRLVLPQISRPSLCGE